MSLHPSERAHHKIKARLVTNARSKKFCKLESTPITSATTTDLKSMWSSRRAEKKTDAVSLSSTLGDPTTMLIVEYFKNVMHHYKEGNLRYPTIAYISLVHIAAGVGLFKLLDCSTETLLWALLWISR